MIVTRLRREASCSPRASQDIGQGLERLALAVSARHVFQGISHLQLERRNRHGRLERDERTAVADGHQIYSAEALQRTGRHDDDDRVSAVVRELRGADRL